MIDSLLEFSDEQAITVAAASTNSVDLGAREISFGTPVPIEYTINETFNNLTSLTIALETTTADDTDFSEAVTLVSETILKANLYAGDNGVIFFPKGNKGLNRLYLTPNGSAPSTGKISAYIADALQQGHHNK